MDLPLAPKQLEFLIHSTAKWNFAHGSVRSGKTVCTLFRFLHAITECPDSDIWMIGKTSSTIYDNAINLILTSPQFAVFKPFCVWQPGHRVLLFKDKVIRTVGALNEGSVGLIQGKTMSLVYCDEMTLYPISFIQMLDTRLSKKWSMGFGSMNPTYPSHPIKEWIDKGEEGNPEYYSLHFTLDDNPYLEDSYKNRIRNSSGIFYKRNYLGLWCLAEGSIFDFFDRDIHVVGRPKRSMEYWIAGIDVGTSNAFALTLIGICTGKYDQAGIHRWVEKEYFWSSTKEGRQKTYGEYIDDIEQLLADYGVQHIYVDPSAAAFKLELRKRGYHPIDANNDVVEGINYMTNEMKAGNLTVSPSCKNLIREIESYVWHPKCIEKGEDEPYKRDDHAVDAMRYAVYSHKIAQYDYDAHRKLQNEWMQNKYQTGRSNFR